MKALRIAAVILASAIAPTAFAEKAPTPSTMEIVREGIMADKKAIVAVNLNLSDGEARTFWPVYDAYQKDLQAITERRARLIATYAEAYNNGTLTDAIASKLINDSLAIDSDEVALQRPYADVISKILSPIKTARYLQIEGKIRAIIRYDLAANIPLVP